MQETATHQEEGESGHEGAQGAGQAGEAEGSEEVPPGHSRDQGNQKVLRVHEVSAPAQVIRRPGEERPVGLRSLASHSVKCPAGALGGRRSLPGRAVRGLEPVRDSREARYYHE